MDFDTASDVTRRGVYQNTLDRRMVRVDAFCTALRRPVERRYAPLPIMFCPRFLDSVRHSLTYLLENFDE